ncbi:coil containing protein [Vibrio phage 1.123.O._10N.286.48.F3]|nr:coil containing protein [Vibrio phage 1.123.O._10N.286.48.F3]
MSEIEEFLLNQGFDTKIGKVYPEYCVLELTQIVRDEYKQELKDLTQEAIKATEYYCENHEQGGHMWMVCKLNDIITGLEVISGIRDVNGELTPKGPNQ